MNAVWKVRGWAGREAFPLGVVFILVWALGWGELLSQPQLLRMEYEELPAENVLIDREDRGLLIVESTIPKLVFIGSNRPIPADPGVKEKMPGVWYVYLSVGTTLLTIQAEGYLPLQDIRINLQPRQAKKLRVTGEQPKGTGSLRIETEPPGAKVIFNKLPVPGVTPLTLSDQPTGAHNLRVEREGYQPVEETVVVEKDKTITRRFVLRRIYAGLRVTSEPSGAQVYLDGNLLGTTPLERSDLAPREGTLVVYMRGYETSTQPIRLIADQTKAINVDLFPQTGTVSITTDPMGAEVWLDGELVGKYTGAPLTREKLALGSHVARAALEGYDEASATFTVEYNKTAQVALKLNPKPGAIFVVTTPEGADISIDGRPTGQKTPFKLENIPAGEHSIRLMLPGYNDVVKTVTVPPGKTVTLIEAMRAERTAPSETRNISESAQIPIKMFKIFIGRYLTRDDEIKYSLRASHTLKHHNFEGEYYSSKDIYILRYETFFRWRARTKSVKNYAEYNLGLSIDLGSSPISFEREDKEKIKYPLIGLNFLVGTGKVKRGIIYYEKVSVLWGFIKEKKISDAVGIGELFLCHKSLFSEQAGLGIMLRYNYISDLTVSLVLTFGNYY